MSARQIYTIAMRMLYVPTPRVDFRVFAQKDLMEMEHFA